MPSIHDFATDVLDLMLDIERKKRSLPFDAKSLQRVAVGFREKFFTDDRSDVTVGNFELMLYILKLHFRTKYISYKSCIDDAHRVLIWLESFDFQTSSTDELEHLSTFCVKMHQILLSHDDYLGRQYQLAA